MLYENGRAAEAVASYRRAVQLLPAVGILKIDLARALLDTNNADNDREAIRNLEHAVQQESGSFELWRLLASAYSKQNNAGMTSLARAEMAILRGQRAEAQSHAATAERSLPARNAGLAARPGHQGLHQHAAAPLTIAPVTPPAPQSLPPEFTTMRSALLALCAALIGGGAVLAAAPHRACPHRHAGSCCGYRRPESARQADPGVSDRQPRSAGRGDAGTGAQAGQPARRGRPEGDRPAQGRTAGRSRQPRSAAMPTATSSSSISTTTSAPTASARTRP